MYTYIYIYTYIHILQLYNDEYIKHVHMCGFVKYNYLCIYNMCIYRDVMKQAELLRPIFELRLWISECSSQAENMFRAI